MSKEKKDIEKIVSGLSLEERKKLRDAALEKKSALENTPLGEKKEEEPLALTIEEIKKRLSENKPIRSEEKKLMDNFIDQELAEPFNAYIRSAEWSLEKIDTLRKEGWPVDEHYKAQQLLAAYKGTESKATAEEKKQDDESRKFAHLKWTSEDLELLPLHERVKILQENRIKSLADVEQLDLLKKKKEDQKREDAEKEQSFDIDFSKKFAHLGLSKEEAFALPEFKNLSLGQKIYALEVLENELINNLKYTTHKEYGEKLKKAGFLGRIGLKIGKAKVMTDISKDLVQSRTFGVGDQKSILQKASQTATEFGLNIEATENFGYKINFLEGVGERPETNRAFENFNKAASILSTIPESWNNEEAFSDKKTDLIEKLNNYNKAQKSLIIALEREGANADEIRDKILAIDSQIKVMRNAHAHPDAEQAIKDISEESGFMNLAKSMIGYRETGTSYATYSALGFGTRSLTTALWGIAGLPVAATLMGGFRAYNREKEAQGETKFIEQYEDSMNATTRKKLDELEKKLSSYVTHTSGGKTPDGKNIMVAVKPTSGKKLNEYLKIKEEIYKIKSEQHAYRNEQILDAEQLKNKLSQLYTRTIALFDKNLPPISKKESEYTDEEKKLMMEKKEVLRMLANRVSFTEDKIQAGLIRYGKPEERLGQNIDLEKELLYSKALIIAHEQYVYGAGLTDKNAQDVSRRVALYMNSIDKDITKRRKDRVFWQTVKGASYGAVFSLVGLGARDIVHEFSSFNFKKVNVPESTTTGGDHVDVVKTTTDKTPHVVKTDAHENVHKPKIKISKVEHATHEKIDGYVAHEKPVDTIPYNPPKEEIVDVAGAPAQEPQVGKVVSDGIPKPAAGEKSVYGNINPVIVSNDHAPQGAGGTEIIYGVDPKHARKQALINRGLQILSGVINRKINQL